MAQQLMIDRPAGDAGGARCRALGRLCVAAALAAGAIGTVRDWAGRAHRERSEQPDGRKLVL